MKYFMLCRIMDGKEFYGIQCIDRESRIININKREMYKLMLVGEINIEKGDDGLYITGTQQKIDEMPIRYLDEIKKEVNKQKGFVVRGRDEFTGNKLVRHIDELSYDIEVNRIKIVKDFLSKYEKSYGKLLCITGMKRSGKSVLMEQVIRYLLHSGIASDDILLIQYACVIHDENEVDYLIEELEHCKQTYIFIDEITMLNNFVLKSKRLADFIATMGKKVVLSGSDTMVFILSTWEVLLGRKYDCPMTMAMYKDWVNIRKSYPIDLQVKQDTVKKFIDNCTLNDYNVYRSNEEMYNYLIDSLAENILRSFKKNIVTQKLRIMNLEKMDNDKIMFVFYRVCYDAIHYKSENITSGMSVIKGRTLRELASLGVSSNDKEFKDKVLVKLGINPDVIKSGIKAKEYEAMLKIMLEIGILKRIEVYKYSNTGCEYETEYCLTIPSIYNRFIESIMAVSIEKESIELWEEHNSLYGDLIEAMVISQVLEYVKVELDGSSEDVRKVKILSGDGKDSSKGIEIDLLVRGNKDIGTKGCAYDIKMSDKLNSRHFKAFKGRFRGMFPSIAATGNIGIIYTGETTNYKDMKAINIHDFLMDIGKYI